jgi:hypothetical protein
MPYGFEQCFITVVVCMFHLLFSALLCVFIDVYALPFILLYIAIALLI